MKFLDDGLISGLLPAETASFPSPVPTQIVSSDEYLPVPQTVQQKEVEARLIDMSDRLAKRHGERFKPSKLLLDMAKKGETFYGRFAPEGRKAVA